MPKVIELQFARPDYLFIYLLVQWRAYSPKKPQKLKRSIYLFFLLSLLKLRMSTAKFEVVKFDRKINFTLWQVQMRAVLIQSGVQKALKGVKPADMKDADLEDIDEKARSAIQLSLSDEVLHEVISEKTTKALWEKLESLYLKKTLTNKLYKKQCLYSLRISEGTSLGSHIDEFESLIMDLQNLDVKIDYEDQALLLLCSLPSL
ncbi:hypothetical protein ACOSQ2_005298 [Xanthoceras sorbifolium]